MAGFDQLAAPDYPVFIGSEFKQPKATDALFHILPVPMESSVSYGTGTANGPKTILEASWQLEQWDGKSIPGEEGIFTHPPVSCKGKPEAVLNAIAAEVKNIAAMGKLPVGLGGEHTMTFGMVKGLIEAGIEDFGVVQIGAHADLRDSFEGNPFSHACVMKRIVDEDVPLFQLGIRSLCKEEADVRKVYGVKFYDADYLVPRNVNKIDLPDDFPERVYFSIDVAGLDPSIFPSTGTPVPGGLGWYQTLSLLDSIAQQAEVVGFDITEFAPIEGTNGYPFAAALLAYKMMGIVQRNQ